MNTQFSGGAVGLVIDIGFLRIDSGSLRFEGNRRRHGNHLIQSFTPKYLIKPLRMRCNRCDDEYRVGGGMQFEVLIRMSERIMGYERRDVRELSRFRAQEFPARRRIEKKVPNRYRRAGRKPRLGNVYDTAACDIDYGSAGLFRRVAFQMEARYGCNRR